jgi:hypothetical protein
MQQSAGFNPACLHAGQVRKPAYKKKKPTQRKFGRIFVFTGCDNSGRVSAIRAMAMVRLYKQFNFTHTIPEK